MKRYITFSQASAAMRYQSDVPSKINQKFQNKKVDAAFISSVVARGYPHLNLGIVANGEVQSVLLLPAKGEIKDRESATSNVLAKVLGLQGEVMIGDKALQYALRHQEEYIDLSMEWHRRTQLPFVFALLSYHGKKRFFKTLEREFLKKKVKVPRYLLQKAADERGLHVREVQSYLELISYKISTPQKRALKLFYKKVDRI